MLRKMYIPCATNAVAWGMAKKNRCSAWNTCLKFMDAKT